VRALRPLIQRPRSEAASRYRRTPRAPLTGHWRDGRYVVIDLETTGLRPSRDEIISLAAVPISNGRIQAEGAWYSLARPVKPPDERTIVVHGILPSDLATAPALDDAVDQLLERMAGRTCIAHAAWFEYAYLGRALRRRGVRLRGPFIDTALIGRLWLYQRDDYLPRAISLATLARALHLPAHRPHHALGDALTTAQAFLACATHLDALRPQTPGSLALAGRRVEEIAGLVPAGAVYPRADGRDAGAAERGGLENR
jgi:DNA polymerase III subunit epsilon